MKRLILTTMTAAALVLPMASPAWARGGGGHASAGGHGGFSGGHAAVGRAAPAPAPARGENHGGYHGHGGYYGGYYGGFYGPWYGWDWYDPFWYGGSGWAPYAVPESAPTGGLRLEVTPKTAQVYVDGYYAGVVDDFNGHFQHLDLTPGGHHIEVRAPGFQPMTFDTYIQADHTTDYKGSLVPAPPTE